MGLRVNSNIAALNAYRNLSVTDGQMSKSLEKLSSGFRINRAADDAAGLAISEGLRSQIGGLKVAVRNTQDGISVVQTSEGALTETHSILQRMRDLSVQASNSGGMNDDAKKSIQSEMTQLKSELNRIADTTTFNGKKLLDGTYNENFQVGANSGETIAVNIGTSMGSAGLKVDGVDVTKAGGYAWNAAVGAPGAGEAGISAAADATTAAVLTITNAATEDWTATGTKADFEALTGTVSFGGKSFDLGSVQYDDAEDTNGDATVDGADLLEQLNKAASSALGLTYDSTTPANNPFVENGGALDFSVKQAVAGYTDADGSALDDGTNSTAQQVANATATFTAASGAQSAIDAIDNAIKTVSSTRADLGAIQNRFDHTINNLSVAVENLTASESRIRDADMAQEMVQFTRNQILSQAGTSMLAQANQSSQGVLSLLR